MIRLITNSDDFGLTNSITDAIVDTHLNGIMTSTTMMANMIGFNYAVKKAHEYPSLGIGIHFNLTEGNPLSDLSKVPDLINSNGVFKNNAEQRKNLLFGKSKFEQVKCELENQLLKLLDNGIVPTHFDSHHHITGVPLAFKASMEIAKKYKIDKARITNIDFQYSSLSQVSSFVKIKRKMKSMPKAFIHSKNKKDLRKNGFKTPDIKLLPSRIFPVSKDPIEQFIRTLSILKPGVTEISFHPGYKDSDPNDSNKTAELRIRDLAVANSSAVMDYIKKNNIQLVNFKEI